MTTTKTLILSFLMLTVGPASLSLARALLSPSLIQRSSIYRNIITRHRGGTSDYPLNNASTDEIHSTATTAAPPPVLPDITPLTTPLFKTSFGGLTFTSTSEENQRKHRVIFILGGPGAGKGTQSENIIRHYKASHYSVGELLRHFGPASPHADLISNCLVKGQIVPVKISLNLLSDAMTCDSSEYGAKFSLVDGFPRNFDNLGGWCEFMPPVCVTLGAMVFDCPQDALEKRILKRGETSGRSDDNVESARKRFKTFERETVPVVNALDEGGLRVERIQGDRSMEGVWREVKKVFDEFIKDDVLTRNKMLIDVVNNEDSEAYRDICVYGNEDEEEDDGDFFKRNEGGLMKDGICINVVENAKIDVITGTEAVVKYDRIIKDANGEEEYGKMRETRVWHHGKTGWVNVHFTRVPI